MKRLGFAAFFVLLAAAVTPAMAARTYTLAQTAPTAPGEIDMSSTQTLTYNVTNTASGTNAGERIYRVRIRLSGTCTGTGCVATVFTSASAAPAGWTRTAFSTTSITYQASAWANAIPSGSALAFSVVVTAGKSTQDRTETLRDFRAYFTTDTNFSNGVTNAGSVTTTAPGSWILQSLQITSFQTTDTSGVAVSAIAAGQSFRVVITVKNLSSATQNAIVANPTPPAVAKTGSFGGSSPSCSLTSTSPSPFNLTAGSSGTMTYTCTTLASDSGTVRYSVTDVRTSASVTSRTGQSNVLSVSPLSVSIAVKGPYAADATCHFSGDTATFTMTVTNNTSGALTSITPSSLTFNGTNTTVGAFTGPVAACSLPLAVGGTCTYTWTAPVSIIGTYPSSGAKPSFFVTGTATANPGPITSPTATSTPTPQDVDGFVIAVSPTTTNTTSTSQQLTFTITNRACDNLNKVAITVPGGFVYGNDGYSLVQDTTFATTSVQNESWGQSATTFTAPANNAPAADPGRIPNDGSSGDFSLVFSSTPSAAATYTFSLDLTDENGVVRTRTVDVPVATYGTGAINSAGQAAWHEVFQ